MPRLAAFLSHASADVERPKAPADDTARLWNTASKMPSPWSAEALMETTLIQQETLVVGVGSAPPSDRAELTLRRHLVQTPEAMPLTGHAQTLLDRTTRNLSSIIGAAPEHRKMYALVVRVRALWYRWALRPVLFIEGLGCTDASLMCAPPLVQVLNRNTSENSLTILPSNKAAVSTIPGEQRFIAIHLSGAPLHAVPS